MSALDKMSLTQLRGIAQSLGIPEVFSKDRPKLTQEISLKQNGVAPKKSPLPQPVQYDSRLMKRPPAKMGTEEEVRELLSRHVEMGLHLDFPEPERWRMRYSIKEDNGTCRQPLRNILKCANRIMK